MTRTSVPGARSARRPSVLAASLLAVGALALSGCSLLPGLGQKDASGSDDGGASASASASNQAEGPGADQLPEIGTSFAEGLSGDPATDQDYASYYDQQIDWQACEEYVGAECGTLTVPKAWNDPSKGEFHLAMVRLPASGDRQGSLLMNPGGPGGSGVEFVGGSGDQVVSASVREHYDLVGFDPRGVGASDGIRCLDDQQTDQYLAATYDMDTSAGLAQGKDWMTKVASACEQNSGGDLPYLDTLSVARDLDVMRAAVGSEKLDYLGFSYGTYIGETYAELYPERTGRIVLDGVIDPALTGDGMNEGQAKGFENATHAFAEWCQAQRSGSCPLTGTADEGVQQIRDLFAQIDANPLRTTDANRPLTGALARSGVLTGMYSDANWPYLMLALQDAMEGDGSVLLQFADLSSDRNKDGTYNGNGNYAITAVNCLDHPAVEDEAWMAQQSQKLAEEYPTFGPGMGYSGLTCELWPVGPMRTPAPIHADGAAPIVLIGTTGDPATPYEWAQSTRKQMSTSVLLTYEGNGHTAYGRSGGCIEDAVDAYLLQGTVPQDGLTCGA